MNPNDKSMESWLEERRRLREREEDTKQFHADYEQQKREVEFEVNRIDGALRNGWLKHCENQRSFWLASAFISPLLWFGFVAPAIQYYLPKIHPWPTGLELVLFGLSMYYAGYWTSEGQHERSEVSSASYWWKRICQARYAKDDPKVG